MKKAVVLLSGGMDSATTLYIAKKKFKCYCLVFDYGQRNRREITAAKKIAKKARCSLKVARIKFPHTASALLNKKIRLPERLSKKIPVSYVPGRNIIFLSMAASYAEAIGAGTIFIGVHTQDFSGYPDCRPQFLKKMQTALSTGTKLGKFRIAAPLLKKNKSDIIKIALKHGVPLGDSWSCYAGGKRPCGKCDACRYRAKGFYESKNT